MRVTLTPVLSSREKILLRAWLIQTLENEKLSNSITFPIPSRRLVVYIDKAAVTLSQGTWEKHPSEIYLGRENPYDPENPPQRDRLSILLTLTQLCEPSVELTKACSEAITHYLLGEFRTVSEQLVSAPVPVSGLAFCSDNRVASLLGSEWMLPSGEVVDVSGPEWTVCASVVPVVETPVVSEISTQETPALSELQTTEAPLDGEFQFQVGQRVHWSGGAFGEHDGEITATPTEHRSYYSVRDGQGRAWAATATELRVLEPDTEVSF